MARHRRWETYSRLPEGQPRSLSTSDARILNTKSSRKPSRRGGVADFGVAAASWCRSAGAELRLSQEGSPRHGAPSAHHEFPDVPGQVVRRFDRGQSSQLIGSGTYGIGGRFQTRRACGSSQGPVRVPGIWPMWSLLNIAMMLAGAHITRFPRIGRGHIPSRPRQLAPRAQHSRSSASPRRSRTSTSPPRSALSIPNPNETQPASPPVPHRAPAPRATFLPPSTSPANALGNVPSVFHLPGQSRRQRSFRLPPPRPKPSVTSPAPSASPAKATSNVALLPPLRPEPREPFPPRSTAPAKAPGNVSSALRPPDDAPSNVPSALRRPFFDAPRHPNRPKPTRPLFPTAPFPR
jgi:hypothetical protein